MYLETRYCFFTILEDADELLAHQDNFLVTQDKKKEILNKNIANHSDKIASITKLPFSKMGDN